MRSLLYSLRKHSAFTSDEIIQILVTSIFGGFFFTFNKWGFEEFSYSVGIQNLIAHSVLLLVILFSGVIAQKVIGIVFGYKITYHYSWIGLIIGFFITGLTNGFFPFFLPGGIDYKKIKSLRMGQLLSDYKYSELFLIASIMPLVPLILCMPLGVLYLLSGSLLVKYLLLTCILTSIYALVPLPRLLSPKNWNLHGVTDFKFQKFLRGGTYGYDLFNFSFGGYQVIIFFVLAYSALIYLFQFYSFILSFILGILMLWGFKLVYNYLKK